MRQIFSKANEVIACVGTDSEINREAMSILSQPRCSFPNRHRHREPFTSQLRIRVSRDDFDQDYLEDIYASTRGGQRRGRKILESFFALPYWRRVWIIQEVTVASTVFVVCGNERVSWDMLAIADAFYWDSESKEWAYVKKMILFREECRRGARPSLLYAMDQTYDALSTDPRDKIFALLGLCHDGDELVPIPNYKQSVDEILRDFTRAVISAKRCLDYVSLPRIRDVRIPRTPGTQELSSWTVDWLHLGRHSQSISDSFRPVSDFRLLDGAGPDTLMMDGTIIDVVDRCRTLSPPQTEAIYRASRGYYKTMIDLADAIFTSLCMDSDDLSEQRRTRLFFFSKIWTEGPMCLLTPYMHAKALEACRKGTITSGYTHLSLKLWTSGGKNNYARMERDERRQFEKAFTNWLEDLGTWKIFEKPLWSFKDYIVRSFNPEPDVDIVMRKLFTVYQNRMKLITTKRGLIGMAHAHTDCGDKLCYLAGCSYPVVLRPVKLNGRAVYQLVGGAHMVFAKEDPKRQWTELGYSECFEII
jgi:hypothetical protein